MFQVVAPLTVLGTIEQLLSWYEANLCNCALTDPRGYRVRFRSYDFVHFIKLTTRYGQEHRNRRSAVEGIKRGVIRFEVGRFDEQRAPELDWVRCVATQPDMIGKNSKPRGTGLASYGKGFGDSASP